jgi:Tol biopolymer transport system component
MRTTDVSRNAPVPCLESSVWPSVTCLILCAVLSFAATGEAQAAWPGKDGPIVYSGYRYAGEDGEESMSEGLRRFQVGQPETLVALTDDPTDAGAAVSPDGRWVVFTRSLPLAIGGSQGAIFVVDIDGGSLRQASTPPPNASDSDPTFDASGTRIVFARTYGDGQHIYTMPVSGGPIRQLSKGSNVIDSNPAVSPSGRQIVFQRTRIVNTKTNRESPTRIYSMRQNGSHLLDLTAALKGDRHADAGQPDFSPDGKQIAFTMSLGFRTMVFVMRANGRHMRRVTRPRRSYGVTYSNPSFSPFGERIVLTVGQDRAATVLGRVRSVGRDNPVGSFGRVQGYSPTWGPTAG